MKTINGIVAAVAVCAMAGFALPGCNTFRGAGKDIQKGGKAIEDAAENKQTDQRYQQENLHAISASADSGGTIYPSGTTDASSGSNQTFKVSANKGYHVADVLVDGKSMGAISRHTFENVTASHTIAAIFTVNPKQ
jgi:predicted small secreted protein